MNESMYSWSYESYEFMEIWDKNSTNEFIGKDLRMSYLRQIENTPKFWRVMWINESKKILQFFLTTETILQILAEELKNWWRFFELKKKSTTLFWWKNENTLKIRKNLFFFKHFNNQWSFFEVEKNCNFSIFVDKLKIFSKC